jgi:hypothetical protein
MITVEMTPQHAGVTIAGDYEDFDSLYDALYRIIGGEGENHAFESSKMRILGLCYDLRHAAMGDRGIRVVDNNMTSDKMKASGKVLPATNVYYDFQVLMPEMFFIMMALNDFCLLKARKETRLFGESMLQKKVIWDRDIAQVRMLQSAVFSCLCAVLEQKTVTRLLNLMIQDYPWTDGYITQYVDELNVEILKMEKEKRLKYLTLLAKRLTELDAPEYLGLRREIKEYAKAMGVAPDEVRLDLSYPEVEW